MIKKLPLLCLLLLNGLFLVACGDGRSQIKQFMQETDASSTNVRIQELPKFTSPEPFAYSAAKLRSPFNPPESIEFADGVSGRSDVEPNENRAKEFLEQFDIDTLTYVGSISQGDSRWALVRDADAKIHRVSVGGYLGKDHGRLSVIDEESITILEIVPNGLNNWIERPRRLAVPASDGSTAEGPASSNSGKRSKQS